MKILVAAVFTLSAFGQNHPAPKPAAAPQRTTGPSAKPGITGEQADAILSELRQIRQLLERQQAALIPPEPVAQRGKMKITRDDRVVGSATAPLTMVEFTDYQCPFCKDFHTKTFPALKRDFIDTGKLRFVAKDMPLDFHQNAQGAAEAAQCAGEQGHFWQMRDAMFQNSPKLAREDLLRYAAELALNKTPFEQCLNSHKFEVDVRLSLALAGSLKISGTPAFLVGASTPDGVEGEIVEGAMPVSVFAAKINELLGTKPAVK